jgi:hypothetical protein
MNALRCDGASVSGSYGLIHLPSLSPESTNTHTNQDKVFTAYEALNALELPESITVEYFVGSSSSSLLMALANKVRGNEVTVGARAQHHDAQSARSDPSFLPFFF